MTHTQPSLPFQPHSPTSRAAAASMADRGPTIRDEVRAYIEANGPVTDEQIINGLGRPGSTIRPRRIELWRDNLIHAAGHDRTARGRKAVTWAAGPAPTN